MGVKTVVFKESHYVAHDLYVVGAKDSFPSELADRLISRGVAEEIQEDSPQVELDLNVSVKTDDDFDDYVLLTDEDLNDG